MRKCPVRDCKKMIGEKVFICSWHWQRLPWHVRDTISQAHQRYAAEEISLTEMRSVTSQALDQLGGSDGDAEDAPFCTAAGTCSCGRPLLFPTKGVRPFPCAVDPAGDHVIIGSRVQPAGGKPAVLTRVSFHWCPPHGKA